MDMIIREWMRYQCKAYFEFELFYFDGEIFLQVVDQLIYFKSDLLKTNVAKEEEVGSETRRV
jgi:hypothetical protein